MHDYLRWIWWPSSLLPLARVGLSSYYTLDSCPGVWNPGWWSLFCCCMLFWIFTLISFDQDLDQSNEGWPIDELFWPWSLGCWQVENHHAGWTKWPGCPWSADSTPIAGCCEVGSTLEAGLRGPFMNSTGRSPSFSKITCSTEHRSPDVTHTDFKKSSHKMR